MRKRIFLFFGILFSVNYAFAQLITDIHVLGGYSNLKKRDFDNNIEWGNYYTKSTCYGVGTNLMLPLKSYSTSIGSGIDFLSLASINNMPDEFINDTNFFPPYTGPFKWTLRFYSVSIPIFMNYKFAKWFELSAGFSNNFFLNKPSELHWSKLYKYNLSIFFQATLVAKESFLLTIDYNSNLTPIVQLKTSAASYNIFLHFESISIRLGYRFKQKTKS